MLLVVKFLAKVLTVLNSEISPRQIAAGFAFGVLIGLVPVTGLLPLLLLLAAFLVNINLSIMAVSTAIFKLVAFGLDPVANRVGYTLLAKTAALHGLWTKLYNMPVVPYTKFNNTLVLGSFVIGILLLIPMYFVGLWGVEKYRRDWREKVLASRIMQAFKASSVYKLYQTYQGFKGE